MNITGNIVQTFKLHWVALHDSFIGYYESDQEPALLGIIQIDSDLAAVMINRLEFQIRNRTRKVSFQTNSNRETVLWVQAVNSFYAQSPRKQVQPYQATFPPRLLTPLALYPCGKQYFSALAEGLLSAREEIFITAWKLSPSLLLSRPPAPPLRLDQILKHKADRGVKIYVLLYKEVGFHLMNILCVYRKLCSS
jgi:phospholipase D1/2